MRYNSKLFSIVMLALYLCAGGNAIAQVNSFSEHNITTSQDLDDELISKQKVKIGFSWTGEVVTNHSGGLEQGTGYFGKIGLNLELSLKDVGLSNGGRIFINALNVHGDTPSSRLIGDFQPISRDEASERTGLFELWYEHSFNATKVTLGQHDMNSSFGSSRVGGNSVHSAFGVFPSVSPNLGFAFSIYPRTMPGIYVNHQVNNFIIKSALYSGASHDFDDDKHNLRWNLDDSGFFITEVTYRGGVSASNPSEYKFGAFKHTGSFDNLDVNNTNISVSPDLGFYSIVDHTLSFDQRLSVFAEATYFPGDHNFSKLFYATGFEMREPFQNRKDDVFFFGFLSTSLSESALSGANIDEDSRSIIEMNYKLALPHGFTLKPDVQYIINPGVNSNLDNVLVSVVKLSYKF